MKARAEPQRGRGEQRQKDNQKGLHKFYPDVLSEMRAGAADRTAIDTPTPVDTVCSGAEVDGRLSSTLTPDMPHSATTVARGEDTRSATNWKEGV